MSHVQVPELLGPFVGQDAIQASPFKLILSPPPHVDVQSLRSLFLYILADTLPGQEQAPLLTDEVPGQLVPEARQVVPARFIF